MLGQQLPALRSLALDVGLAGLPLSIEGVELLIQSVLGRFAGIDGAAQRSRGVSLAWRSPPSLDLVDLRPKNRGPFHLVPVMRVAISDRLVKVFPS